MGSASLIRNLESYLFRMATKKKRPRTDDCVLPPHHPLPARELSQYSVDGDPHTENDIASYVQGQARDETVQHVEKIKEEFVLGGKYEIWDVITEKDRYWVITNLTNLYSQKYFPSLDYTLSFHIGLMMRLRSRPENATSRKADPSTERSKPQN
jgi:hypothetical protein